MNSLIGKCPICSEDLVVTRLECAHCGTDIGGHFGMGPLFRLDPEDVKFVEIFVKNRGNAYRVGEELNMSYSSVRARLTGIIGALGYESPAEAKDESTRPPEKRKAILDDLAGGKISSEQAIRLLEEE